MFRYPPARRSGEPAVAFWEPSAGHLLPSHFAPLKQKLLFLEERFVYLSLHILRAGDIWLLFFITEVFMSDCFEAAAGRLAGSIFLSRRLMALILFFCMESLIAGDASAWLTRAESSNFTETPRYAETIDYCRRIAGASPLVDYTSFGISPEGRELPLVIIDGHGNFTPEAVRASGNAVVLIQNGIHAGESDGKDASLLLLRDLSVSGELSALLDSVTVLIIPIFNVDGHERFGPYNRINQNGPSEMGFRATAQNLNLNRDYLKADAPEMQAWLRLFNRWLPDLMVDTHVTDGADHQYVLTYAVGNDQDVSPSLRRWTRETLEPFLNTAMQEDGYPVLPYFWMRDRTRIRRGLLHGPFSPRYSTGYGAAQNRIFYLIETHMLKDYRTRVMATRRLLQHILRLANRRSRRLQMINLEADRETAHQLAGRQYPLRLEISLQDSTEISFLGVEYKVEESSISGSGWVQYGQRPETYRLPFFSTTKVVDSTVVPFAYLIPPQWTLQIDRLAAHGVPIRRLAQPVTVEVGSYQFRNVSWRDTPFEGHHLVNFETDPLTEVRTFPAGTAVVFMNHRTNRVAINLLEPQAPDSFVRWGFWDSIFERKEYAEDYVLEEMARQMLAEKPELRAEFEAALSNDPRLAANPRARLNFFYERTPYWEKQVNIYPVGKLMSDVPLPLEALP